MMMSLPRTRWRASLLALSLLLVGSCLARVLMPVFWFLGFSEGTYQGPNTDFLDVGQAVTITADRRAAPADRVIEPTDRSDYKSAMYHWPTCTPEGKIAIKHGTRGVVKVDPAWDEDCCYPERPIAIELSEGGNRGSVVAVPRRLLRRKSAPSNLALSRTWPRGRGKIARGVPVSGRSTELRGGVLVVTVAAGVLASVLAYAGWRWGLGSRNWLEGVVVSAVAGAAVGTLAWWVLRLLEAASA